MFGFMGGIPLLWLALILAWTLPWKGYALWLSARNGSARWFVALLLINTLGILDIIYIFAFGRPAMKRREAEPSAVSES